MRRRTRSASTSVALGIAGIAGQPVGILQPTVANMDWVSAYAMDVGANSCEKAGRVLRDVGKVRRMPTFVKQSVDGACPTSHLVGFSLGVGN